MLIHEVVREQDNTEPTEQKAEVKVD